MQTNKTFIIILTILTTSSFTHLSAMHALRAITPVQVRVLQQLVRSGKIQPAQATQLVSRAVAPASFQPQRHYAVDHNKNVRTNTFGEFKDSFDALAKRTKELVIKKLPTRNSYPIFHPNLKSDFFLYKKFTRIIKEINPVNKSSEDNYNLYRNEIKAFLLTYHVCEPFLLKKFFFSAKLVDRNGPMGLYTLFNAVTRKNPDYEMILILLHLGVSIHSEVILEDGEVVTI
ncbi:MAG: hypothetical protein P4L22_03890, partial [Candidatus Babeliales bacterium]|nr:hypothetical protein [Candidatus Babeliales bacterium]